ncbi:MAG TPA: thiamine phosphate synthase [Candidatus Latescibacteria bacterium]|nr:thiamine phosphate synthase [Candidatus Latescibacterota bacterium]
MRFEFPSRFYFITYRPGSRNGILQDVREALEAGVRIVQYREKELPLRRQLEEAAELLELCGNFGAALVVDDRVDIALAVGADGVHLGPDDMPTEIARMLLGAGKLVGVSVRGVEEALKAQEAGADYLGVGPIFPTSTKPDAGPPIGLQGLRAVRRAVHLPIVAIGGITPERARAAMEAGADAVCAISAVVGERVGEKIRAFLHQVEVRGDDPVGIRP